MDTPRLCDKCDALNVDGVTYHNSKCETLLDSSMLNGDKVKTIRIRIMDSKQITPNVFAHQLPDGQWLVMDMAIGQQATQLQPDYLTARRAYLDGVLAFV